MISGKVVAISTSKEKGVPTVTTDVDLSAVGVCDLIEAWECLFKVTQVRRKVHTAVPSFKG